MTEATSEASTERSIEHQVVEQSKKRRVLKTHRNSVDESNKEAHQEVKLQPDFEEEEETLTTDSLKDILDVSKLPPPSNDEPQDLDAEKVYQNGSESQKNKGKRPEGAPPSNHEPSATLYITNFVRPLTLPAVRALLEQYGVIEYFWMNKIKSHCYVKFESVESAVITRNSLWNVKWPPETGRSLVLDFFNFEKALEAINQEEAKQNATRSRAPSKTTINRTEEEEAPRQNVSFIPLENLFNKTTATPSLYYKPLPREEAEAKMQEMAKKRRRS
ncbi:hypothetical protein G9A89_018059 [Geosiphon pyriformis]|nr:hypothetical protein G9A89_018059 [Geosiphon pyriformis]